MGKKKKQVAKKIQRIKALSLCDSVMGVASVPFSLSERRVALKLINPRGRLEPAN